MATLLAKKIFTTCAHHFEDRMQYTSFYLCFIELSKANYFIIQPYF